MALIGGIEATSGGPNLVLFAHAPPRLSTPISLVGVYRRLLNAVNSIRDIAAVIEVAMIILRWVLLGLRIILGQGLLKVIVVLL